MYKRLVQFLEFDFEDRLEKLVDRELLAFLASALQSSNDAKFYMRLYYLSPSQRYEVPALNALRTHQIWLAVRGYCSVLFEFDSLIRRKKNRFSSDFLKAHEDLFLRIEQSLEKQKDAPGYDIARSLRNESFSHLYPKTGAKIPDELLDDTLWKIFIGTSKVNSVSPIGDQFFTFGSLSRNSKELTAEKISQQVRVIVRWADDAHACLDEVVNLLVQQVQASSGVSPKVKQTTDWVEPEVVAFFEEHQMPLVTYTSHSPPSLFSQFSRFWKK